MTLQLSNQVPEWERILEEVRNSIKNDKRVNHQRGSEKSITTTMFLCVLRATTYLAALVTDVFCE